jgi:hypothetical protein
MQKIILMGNPIPDKLGEVAQSVERETENLCVGGSIPPLATPLLAPGRSLKKSHLPVYVIKRWPF